MSSSFSLSPAMPYNVLNYALAVTAVGVREYALGSLVGMLPQAILHLYLGSLGFTVAQLAGGTTPGAKPWHAAVYWGSLVCIVLAAAIIMRRARAALTRSLDSDTPPL